MAPSGFDRRGQRRVFTDTPLPVRKARRASLASAAAISDRIKGEQQVEDEQHVQDEQRVDAVQDGGAADGGLGEQAGDMARGLDVARGERGHFHGLVRELVFRGGLSNEQKLEALRLSVVVIFIGFMTTYVVCNAVVKILK